MISAGQAAVGSQVRWPVRTGRLTIRPATAADADAAWNYRRLPEVTRWMSNDAPDLGAFRELFTLPDRLAKTLMVELDGAVVGDLMLAVEDAWAQAEIAGAASAVQAEIGWCLDPAHQGHGLATEAVTELLRICFAELGLRRVVALCFAANDPSWRLMERVGMRREQHAVRDSLHRTGVWMDGLAYALLAPEWAGR